MKKKYLYTAIMLFAILVAGMGLTGWYVRYNVFMYHNSMYDVRHAI